MLRYLDFYASMTIGYFLQHCVCEWLSLVEIRGSLGRKNEEPLGPDWDVINNCLWKGLGEWRAAWREGGGKGVDSGQPIEMSAGLCIGGSLEAMEHSLLFRSSLLPLTWLWGGKVSNTGRELCLLLHLLANSLFLLRNTSLPMYEYLNSSLLWNDYFSIHAIWIHMSSWFGVVCSGGFFKFIKCTPY